MTWLICENVCNSLATSEDFANLSAIMLTQAKGIFKNEWESCHENDTFNEDFANLSAIMLPQAKGIFNN